MKITLDEMKETKRLSLLVKKFDNLSGFGKELMFCFLMGYSHATKEEDTFKMMLEEMEKLKGFGE